MLQHPSRIQALVGPDVEVPLKSTVFITLNQPQIVDPAAMFFFIQSNSFRMEGVFVISDGNFYSFQRASSRISAPKRPLTYYPLPPHRPCFIFPKAIIWQIGMFYIINPFASNVPYMRSLKLP